MCILYDGGPDQLPGTCAAVSILPAVTVTCNSTGTQGSMGCSYAPLAANEHFAFCVKRARTALSCRGGKPLQHDLSNTQRTTQCLLLVEEEL